MILGYRNERGHDLKGVSAPVRVDGERLKLSRPPPALGQDGAMILSELSYAPDEVDALLANRVVVAGEART